MQKLTSVLLMLLVSTSVYAVPALPPIVLTFACPSGSKFTYGLEITEDKNGDGVMDTRSYRDCSGKWTSDCWPVSCSTRTLVTEVCPTAAHTFTTAYDATLGMYTWTLTEVVSPTNSTTTGTLVRQSPTALNYTSNCTMPIRQSGSNQYNSDQIVGFQPQLNIHINVSTPSLQVTCAKSGAARISLSTISGQLVWESQEELKAGDNILSNKLPDVARGCYVITVATADAVYSKVLVR